MPACLSQDFDCATKTLSELDRINATTVETEVEVWTFSGEPEKRYGFRAHKVPGFPCLFIRNKVRPSRSRSVPGDTEVQTRSHPPDCARRERNGVCRLRQAQAPAAADLLDHTHIYL